MSVADLMIGTGPVVQLVLVTLAGFSIGSWGIIIYKLVQISRARRESERFIAIFWESKNLAAIHTASVRLKSSPGAQGFRAGYQELLQLTRAKRQAVGAESGFSTDLGGVENVTRAMKRQTNVELAKLGKGLSSAHTSNIQAVAPGIAEALITTAFGIVVAVPAQVFYNHLATRSHELATEMDNFTSEFLNIAERHFLS